MEAEAGAELDTSSDIALARMLQMQYDKEHNQLIQAQEKKYNGSGKGNKDCLVIDVKHFDMRKPVFGLSTSCTATEVRGWLEA